MTPDKIIRIANSISAPGKVRTAGKIEFIRDQGPLRRDIRADDFTWSPDALRNLTKILWAAQRAHSYSVSALRLFSKMPSSEFSPDGLLGGRGYIQSIKDLRKILSQASEILSSFTDTLYDEINASHWEDSETTDSKKLLKDTEEVKEDPEKFVEDEFKSEEDLNFLDSDPNNMNPSPEDYGMPESDEEDSEEESDDNSGFAQQASARSTGLDNYNHSLSRILKSPNSRTAGSNSSLPISTMPGPRVEHIGPAESTYGFVNGPDALPSDDESMSGFITDQPIYEDDVADGVSPYTTPTNSDNTAIHVSSDGYSWLPGSENLKIMPIYDRNLSKEDVAWLVANSAPKNPINAGNENKRPSTAWIWEDV